MGSMGNDCLFSAEWWKRMTETGRLPPDVLSVCVTIRPEDICEVTIVAIADKPVCALAVAAIEALPSKEVDDGTLASI